MKGISKSTFNRQKISSSIIEAVKESEIPISTTDISKKINKSWHTIDRHCLKLQLEGRITGFKVGNMNLWAIKK